MNPSKTLTTFALLSILNAQSAPAQPLEMIVREGGRDTTKVVDIDTSRWGYSLTNPATSIDQGLYQQLNDSTLSSNTEKKAVESLRKTDGKYVAIKPGKSLPLNFDAKMPNGIKEVHVIPHEPENAKYRVQAVYKTENGGYAVSCDQSVVGEFKRIIEGPVDTLIITSESEQPVKIDRVSAFYNKSGIQEKEKTPYTPPKKEPKQNPFNQDKLKI